MNRYVPSMITGLVCLASPAGAADGEGAGLAALQQEVTALIEEVEPSIVSVVRGQFEEPNEFRGELFGRGFGPDLPWNRAALPDDPSFVPDQFGAGVIIAGPSGERMIVTNQHVVSGARVDGVEPPAAGAGRVYVRLHDGRGFYARVRAADPRSDLAVLVAEGNDETIDLPRGLALSDAKSYRKGQIVFVFGNPYGVARDGSASVAWGMIGNVLRRPAPFERSLEREARKDETVHHYGTLLQLDCRADLGFSGGATVDRAGKLIGLTTSLAALEGYESTTGFAIPINNGIRRVLQSLLRGHEPEYGFLGVGPAELSAAQMRAIDSEWDKDHGAVLVEFVKPGSAGDAGGLRAGDAIASVDGVPMTTSNDLFREIGLAGPGARVPITVYRSLPGKRESERLSLTVRLDKWPVINDAELVATVPRWEPWHGLRVDYATSRAKYVTAQLEPYPRGVVVLEAAEPVGNADPIQPGDFIVAVNESPVSSPKEFYSLVREAEMVTLRLADGREISVP